MTIEVQYKAAFDSRWDIGAVRRAFAEAAHVVLVAHQNADGDAVGSLLGMWHLLRQAVSAEVTPLLPDGVPGDLDWLPGADAIVSGKADEARCAAAIDGADLIVCLDLNTIERTGRLADRLHAAKAAFMQVDHHERGEDGQSRDWSVAVVEPEASSACELVYWLMREAYGEGIFTRETAECLYTGICTDTGTFSYSNDRQSVYLAAAGLLAHGIDPMRINRQIKNVFTEERLRFFGHAMADLLEVYPKRQVALIVLTEAEMKAYGVESADITGLINEVMKLRTVDCGILVREEGEKVRLSLRSKERYDVNLMARGLFGGGGHKRAAGATAYAALQEVVDKIKREVIDDK
ncbi:MAG: DHH family phosphoesterase [Bacteroidales bacterium]|nr:DHH family phosphoesterase [Bacteroidales bacterium]